MCVLEKLDSSHLADFLGLELGKGVDGNVLHEGVELLLGILVLVSLSGNSDTNLSGHVADTVHPDESVQSGVNTHVLQNGR